MLRRYLPRSLYARVILIVILPIFLIQSLVTYFFFERHWDAVTANLSRTTAGEIALMTSLYEQAPNEETRQALSTKFLEDLNISIRLSEGEIIPSDNKLSVFNLYNTIFDNSLRTRLNRPYWLNTQSWPNYIEIRVQLDNGALVFFVLRDRVFATTGRLFIIWLIGTSVLIGFVAIIFLRNQVRSILRLANAAEAFGLGRDEPNFRPTGATEVRRAGRAFIAMRERIKRHLGQRTTMLAGVSHDLRTPLTRLKLSLEMDPTADELNAMRADVAEMQRMVEAYLDFASDVSVTEPLEMINLLDLVQEVNEETLSAVQADDNSAMASVQKKIAMLESEPVHLDGRRTALKRAIGNLISNAIKYGNEANVSLIRNGVYAEISVDDDGPGIAPDQHERAFKPFERLDDARNQKIPGIGLGLAIVRDAARSHGGEVELSASSMGGLRAILRLPI